MVAENTNTSKKTEFSYSSWLRDLRIGDEVRLSGKVCTINDVVEMWGAMVLVVCQGPNLYRYFSRENGRELGSRRGTYKSDNLRPYTKEERLAAEKAEKEKEDKAMFITAAEKLFKQAFGTPDISFYKLEKYLSLRAIEDLTKILDKAKWVPYK